ncbi:MAG: hypothetical protein ACRC5C_06925, partial [Bacilli bacterium]
MKRVAILLIVISSFMFVKFPSNAVIGDEGVRTWYKAMESELALERPGKVNLVNTMESIRPSFEQQYGTEAYTFVIRNIRRGEWESVHKWKDMYYARHMKARIDALDPRATPRNKMLQSIVEFEKDVAVLSWPAKDNLNFVVGQMYAGIGYSPSLRWWT